MPSTHNEHDLPAPTRRPMPEVRGPESGLARSANPDSEAHIRETPVPTCTTNSRAVSSRGARSLGAQHRQAWVLAWISVACTRRGDHAV